MSTQSLHRKHVQKLIQKHLKTAALGLLLGWSCGLARAQALEFEANVPAQTKTQMLQDLKFMTTLTGSKVSKLHQDVYGTMNGTGYSDWFTSRVMSVGFDATSTDGSVAYVAPFIDSSKVFLTRNFTSFDHPQIARMMVVYHEARHTEDDNGNWPHATCPVPFRDANGVDLKSIWTGLALAGQPGCDEHAIGAYGTSLIMLKNISLNCESCTEKVKMDAGLYADDQLVRIIDPRAHAQLIQDLAH